MPEAEMHFSDALRHVALLSQDASSLIAIGPRSHRYRTAMAAPLVLFLMLHTTLRVEVSNE